MKSAADAVDRAAGAIVGAFVGDALGVGPHWYYDLGELRRKFGPWISDYTDPRSEHGYHAGMKAGELSQTGIIMLLLLRSVAERGGYNESDFTHRLETELFPNLNGEPFHGPGGYTNQSIREAWKARVKEGKAWGETAGHADTSEAAERIVVLAARYARDPEQAARIANSCCRLTQNDELVVQSSVAFGCVVAALIRGEALDGALSEKLMKLVESGDLPFTVEKTSEGGKRTKSGPPLGFASPDALLLPSWCARAASDPDIRIEPAWKVSLVYGMSCAIPFVLPAAYYLAARFAGDFECAVLHAINGGGQNMSRACLTGALAGAQCGLHGIPERFVNGLRDGSEIVALARQVAERMAPHR